MTPLGLGAEHCREALERYRQHVSGLMGLLETPQGNGLRGATLAAYDELLSRFEVDARARSGGAGSARMSQVESELFAPVVRDIHQDLVIMARQRPSPKWVPLLQQIDAKLLAAEDNIDRWQRQVGVD